jgi:putative zinc finger protein
MPPRHVEQFFSAAYDDELSEQQAEQFHEHIRGCAACAAAYDTFRASVDAVRAMPQARMPVAVHLPSTAPVAEHRPPWRRSGFPRLRVGYGGATLVGAVAAAVIVAVLLVRPTGNSGSPTSLQAGGSNPQGALNSNPSCPGTLAGLSVGDPPAGYHHIGLDVSRPGQRLVVATSTGDVAAGSQVIVYAQLTVPLAAAAAPGTPGAAAASGAGAVALVPCISVTGIGNAAVSPLAAVPAPNSVQNDGLAPSALSPSAIHAGGALSSPLFEFTVPPGTPPGTKLFIVATVPPGYPRAGDQLITVDLELTVR